MHADIPHPEGGDPISVAQQQDLFHSALLRQLEAALTGRTSGVDLRRDRVCAVRFLGRLRTVAARRPLAGRVVRKDVPISRVDPVARIDSCFNVAD